VRQERSPNVILIVFETSRTCSIGPRAPQPISTLSVLLHCDGDAPTSVLLQLCSQYVP